MLRIRPEQMRALDRAGAEQLLGTLCAHLRRGAIGGADQLPPEALRARVAGAISVARRHGMARHDAIAAYVTLMFLLGPRFDRHPSIQRILEERASPPDAIVDEMLRRLEDGDWREAQRYDRSWDDIDAPT